ncbi:hypothetical protein DFH11DRAFT_408346 [Phellopilus nigrolimitatus]|nr:hypothetical protein DFH11DRAFT_408346 [Phellopilus nigrolimitatus]
MRDCAFRSSSESVESLTVRESWMLVFSSTRAYPLYRLWNTYPQLCSSLRMSTQSTWSPPPRAVDEPTLKVYNSLTKTKTEFVPRNGRHCQVV